MCKLISFSIIVIKINPKSGFKINGCHDLPVHAFRWRDKRLSFRPTIGAYEFAERGYFTVSIDARPCYFVGDGHFFSCCQVYSISPPRVTWMAYKNSFCLTFSMRSITSGHDWCVVLTWGLSM